MNQLAKIFEELIPAAAAVKKSEEETLIKYFMYFGIVNKDGIELEKPKKENKKEKFFKVA